MSLKLTQQVTQRVLHFLHDHNFIICPNVEHLQLGFNGQLVKNNVYNEWLLNNIIHRDEPTFKLHNIQTELQYVSNLCKNKLPFSVIQETIDSDDVILKSFTLCTTEHSLQFFHQWQRRQKMWWRKFSSEPSRFKLSEINSDEDEKQTVYLDYDMPWKTEQIQTIQLVPGRHNPQLIQVKNGRKQITPDVITSEINLTQATLVHLVDSYETNTREFMRFHRKITPYKVSFAISASNQESGKDLKELSLLLSRQLHSIHVNTLLLPDVTTSSLDSQFIRNDQLGVCYTVVMNEKTLKDGIVGLRNRDTTVKEQCHVSKLKNYIEVIMKNY